MFVQCCRHQHLPVRVSLVIEFATQDSCSQMHPMLKRVIHIGYSKMHDIHVCNYYYYNY